MITDVHDPRTSDVSLRWLFGMVGFLTMLGLLVALPLVYYVRAEPPQIEQMVRVAPNEYAVDRIRVIDGDTIECDILLPLGVTLRQEEIRFSDYDAWESSKRRRSVKVTDEEVVKGKQATALFEELLETSSMTIILEGDGRDVYGRVLGRPVIYAENGARFMLADFMLDNGMWRTDSGKEER